MPPAAEVPSTTMSAPSAPATRLTGAVAPVEVSLCGHPYVSTPASNTGTVIEPGSARRTVGASRCGAASTDDANLAPNSPNAANCAFDSTKPNAAASHTNVEPPFD